jgi:hypothetical protein
LVTKVGDDEVLNGNVCHGFCLARVSARDEGLSTTRFRADPKERPYTAYALGYIVRSRV